MIGEDINERMARLAPSQNIADKALAPAALDAIAALPQAAAAQVPDMQQDQYGLTPAQDLVIKALPSANDTEMKTSLMAARTVNPDQAVRARKAAAQAGVGTDIALRNLEEVERRAFMQDIDRMEIARRDPALAAFLRDRDNAMVAQDDLANLRETKSLYDTIREYPREVMRDAMVGLAAGMVDYRASMYGYDLRDKDSISETERSQLLGMLSLAETIYQTRQPGFISSAARVAGQQVDPMMQAGERGATTGLVFGGAAAVGGQIGPQALLPEELVTVPGAMSLGFTIGATSSFVETSFKQLAGYSYAEMMRENISQREAYWVSGVAGSINAGLELAGLGIVSRPFRQVIGKVIAKQVADQLVQTTTGQIAKTAGKEYLTGIAGEVITEVSQEVVDAVAVSAAQLIDQWGVPSDKRNVKLLTAQGWQELIDKSVKVGVETAKAMAILGVAGPFAKGSYTIVQMEKARKQARFMEQAIDLASRSKLRERDPVAYRNLLEQRAQATPAENVYIDANTMDVIMRQQGITAADMDAVITDFSKRLEEARQSNASIRLSSAEFIAQLSQSDVGRAMAQHLRVGDPNAMSMFDVAQAEAMRQQMLEQSRAAMEARTETDKAFVESANRVEDEIAAMLRDTGKLTPDQVSATAEMMSAFVVVQAAEAKQTPEQFWSRWRNQILGPNAPMVTRPEAGLSQQQIAQADADYMAAVDRGNAAAAQRMVDEAAEQAMPQSVVRGDGEIGVAGKLLRVFHGSGAFIRRFMYEFTAQGVDQLGSGFYFTTDRVEAVSYTTRRRDADTPKVGGEQQPTVVEAYLDIRNPLRAEQTGSISREQVRRFIAAAPQDSRREGLENWGIDGDTPNAKVLDAYAFEDANILRELFKIANDFYGTNTEAFNRAIRDILGYDGVVQDFRVDGVSKKHFVAFFPEQIKSAEAVTRDEAGNVVPLSRRFNLQSRKVYEQTPAAIPSWARTESGVEVTPAIEKGKIANAPTATQAARNYENIDAAFKQVPNPLESEDAWKRFMTILVGSSDILDVPAAALAYAQDPKAVASYLSRLRPDQLASRRAGFALGAKIREQYLNGNATPRITARLLLWAMLSRKAGAYPHEAAYMDLVNAGVDQWIDKAVAGEWTDSDGESFARWSAEFMATRKGGISPSAGVTSNANDFGRILLTKLAERDTDGQVKLVKLHNIIAKKDSTAGEIRRAFFALGDSIGIQNKVLSFALLVTGRYDTLVLDRVQFTHLWGPKYQKRAGISNIYDGTEGGLAPAGEGHYGLAIYEALARGLEDSVREGYRLAGLNGPGDGTLGAFHWDSWLIESSQAIGHPTVEALATERPRPDLAVRQGKFDTYAYNVEYRADGQYQIPRLDGSGYQILSPAETADFLGAIADPKNGVVPKDFKVSKNKQRPWVDAQGVDRAKYDEILSQYGRRADAGDVAVAGDADARRPVPSGAAEPAPPEAGVYAQAPVSPEFYSALERGIQETKAEELTGAQWKERIAALVNKGIVKEAEVEWSMLREYLELPREEKLSKAELQSYLADKGLEIRVITFGGRDAVQGALDEATRILEQANALDDDAVSAIERIRTSEPGSQLHRQSTELLDELLDAAGSDNTFFDLVQNVNPYYEEYAEPDGRNYLEELLQLPETELQKRRFDIRQQLYTKFGLSSILSASEYPQDNPLVQELVRIESKMDKRDLARFTHGHYSAPNVVAHVRRDDRTDVNGQLAMNVTELQSDWAQKGREFGFADTEEQRDLAFWKSEIRRLQQQRDQFEDGPESKRRIKKALKAINNLLASMEQKYSAEQLEQMDMWAGGVRGVKFEVEPFVTFEDQRDVLAGLMVDFGDAGFNEEADAVDSIIDDMIDGTGFNELMAQLDAARQAVQSFDREMTPIMRAPFVESTSGWLNLLLKHVLMKAVEGNYDRIIMSTWQVQIRRYGTDRYAWSRSADGTYRMIGDVAYDEDALADVDLKETQRRVVGSSLSVRVQYIEDLKKLIKGRERTMTDEQINSLAEKIWKRMEASDGVGVMMPRREGMETFYGDENLIDPKTGKLSIVGAALEKLSKKYKGPGITSTQISIEEPAEAVTVVATSPEQAEKIMDWIQNNLPDAVDAMEYDADGLTIDLESITERQRRNLERAFAGEPDSPDVKFYQEMVGIQQMHTRSGIQVTPELRAAVGAGLPLFQDARGTFDPETFVTRVSEAGDVSTVAHETAHYWLEVMGRIAADRNAPARVIEDLDRVLQWFEIAGATPAERIARWNGMTLEEKRRHHEAFALNFELYLFEGKAPSVELHGVFEKFKRWLMVVYKQIRDQLNVQYRQQFGKDLPIMTGEVRQVMDRLLATDEQIKRAQAMRDMMGDFQTQEESGLNDAEWEAYQQLRNEATDEAAREHAKASLRQMQWLSNARSKMLKEMQARHKEMRARVREEVSNTVRMERVYRAIDFLRRGRWINAEGAEETTAVHKLDAGSVERMYALEPEALRPDLSKLGKGKYGILAKEGGMDPELAAEALGYASADEMIRDVIAALPIAEVIDERTDARMLAESGELATPESREEAIDRALHNEARGRFIAVELRLHSKATQPANGMRQAARQVAKQVISGRRIRDIRPREYVAAESRAARDAAAALRDLPDPRVAGQAAFTRSMNEQASAIAAGMPMSDAQAIAEAARQEATRRAQERIDAYRQKYPDTDPAQVVIAAKRNQLLNNQLAAEAIAVRDEIEKALEKFRKLFRPDEKIAKGRDMNLVNAGRAVLAYYGLGRSDKAPAEYLEQMRSYDPELYEELRPLIERAARGPQDYRDLTVDEFRIMRDAVEAFWYGSKRRNQIRVEGQLVDLETATSALMERLNAIGVPEVVAGERRAPTRLDRVARTLNTLKAIARRVEHWAWATDGPGGVGAFTTYIWRPVKDALVAYRVDRNKYVKRFVDLLQTITIQEGKIDAEELNYTFGYGNGGLGKAEVLGAMMHMGNESNLRKLLLGRGWGELDAEGNLVTTRWDAFVSRMFAEGVITKEDMDFLQAVWDLNEEIKPVAQKAHYELFGYYFQEVGASPIVTPFGEYRGGYVPAKTDTFMVADARSKEAMEELESDFRQSMPSTGRGFTRARTEYNRPLSLDIRLMARHIDSVVRFAHVQPAIRDVLRLLRAPEFRDALNRTDPGAINDMLLPWLTRAARQVTMEPGKFKAIDTFWTAVRSRIGASIMFGNLRNALQQLTGAFPAMLRVEPTYFKSALATYLGSPFKVADEVASMSPFMANRMRSQMFELQETMNDILLNPSKYEKIQDWSNKHGYFLQTAHQNIVDIVTWSGAYNQSLAQSGLDAADPVAQREAIAAGDAAVRMTQGSMDPEDVSRVEVGTPFYRTFVQFTGYFNMLANLNSSEYIRVIRDLGWRGNKARLVYIYVMGFMLPTVVADAIVRTLGNQWDDEDEDGYLDVFMSWFFGSQIRAGAAVIPFGSVGLQLVTGGFTSAPYDDRISASPSLAALERATVGTTKAIIAAVDPEKDVSGKNVRDVLTLISLVTGIPLEVIGRPIGYGIDVKREEVEPTSMWDYIRGLITGVASPESKR